MNNAHGAKERAFGSHSAVIIIIVAIARLPGLRFALVGLGLELEHRMKGGDKSFKHDQ
jgi:hypothetical protein